MEEAGITMPRNEEWAPVPLEHGLPRFTRFRPLFAPRQCADYVPQAYRQT